jgi:predicted HTH transcriptional regulator
MSMSLKALRPLISDGESSRMEFKRSTRQQSDAAKALCGILNVFAELDFGMTPAKLSRQYESKPWNPIMENVFYRAGILEKWGSGTLNIIEWCKANANPKPSWTDTAGSAVLRFLPNAAARYGRPPRGGVD